MRDAESLLDQVISFTGRKVEDADIADILGIMDRELIAEASLAVIEGSGPKCLEIVERIYNYGYDTREFYRSLMDQFRNLAVSLIDPENQTLEMSDADRRELRRQAEMAGLERLQQYLNLLISKEEDLRMTSHPRLVLETLLIRLCRVGHLLSFEDILRKLELLEKRLTEGAVACGTESRPAELSESPGRYAPPESAPAKRENPGWEGFLDHVSSKNIPLAKMLGNWRLVALQPDLIELDRGDNSFSATYLDDPERKQRLLEYCTEYFGREMKIRVVPGEKSAPPLESPGKNGPKAVIDLPGPIQDVLEIFKGEIQGNSNGREKK
jgi:DNA polymerase-3 subunit gamma/tau